MQSRTRPSNWSLRASPRERQGLGGVGERLLPVSEFDVDERDRVQRSRLLARILSGVPIGSRGLKMADSLQHRFPCASPVRVRRQRHFARGRDPSPVAVRLRASRRRAVISYRPAGARASDAVTRNWYLPGCGRRPLDIFGFPDRVVIEGEQLFAGGVEYRHRNVYRVLGDVEPRILAGPQDDIVLLRTACWKLAGALPTQLKSR